MKLQETRKKTGRKPEENQKKTKRKPKKTKRKPKENQKKTEENRRKPEEKKTTAPPGEFDFDGLGLVPYTHPFTQIS